MIEFPCPHCSVNISAEPEHAGATASCPTCGQDLVVPVSSVEGRADLQQPVAPSAAGNLPLVRGLHKKSAPRVGKKMVMVGVFALAAVTMIGVIAMMNRTGRKSGVEVVSSTTKVSKVINLTSIGGRLDDFVKKFGNGDAGVIVSNKKMSYSYMFFEIDSNTSLIVGYDDEKFVTCVVYFKHGTNGQSEALPLETQEIEIALKQFSRHEDVGWIESSPDSGSRYWAYLWCAEMKWGSSALMGIYNTNTHYLFVYSGDSGGITWEKLKADRGMWKNLTLDNTK